MSPNPLVRRGTLAALALSLGLTALTACSDDEGSKDEKKGDPSSIEVTQDGLASVDEVTACLEEIGLDASAIEEKPAAITDPVEGVRADLESEQFDDQTVSMWVFETADAAEANRLQITLAPVDTPSSTVRSNLIVRYVYPPAGDEPWVEDVQACVDVVTA